MKNIITVLFLTTSILTIAQSNTVTAGGTAISPAGSITYTIGQTNYTTNTGSNATISQGLQQAFEIVTLSNNEIPQIQLTAAVYPNPTVQNVTLSIKDYDFTDLKYTLFDIQGKLISSGKISQNETRIEMANLPTALYFLKVNNAATDLKTFKIIKNN